MKKQLYTIALALFTIGCQGFLDEKPVKSLIIPQSLADLQALMDDEFLMNTAPGLPVIMSDDFLLQEGVWQSASSATARNGYIWADDLYEGGSNADWTKAYEQVFYSNLVLETLPTITRTNNNANQYDQIKGSAMFNRALAYYHLLTQFAAMEQDGPAFDQYGLVFRETAAIESNPVRITVKESYDFIENELNEALELLQPLNNFSTRPSKASVYALLARLYLYRGDFVKAEWAALEGLSLMDNLIDYNDVNPSLANPFPRFNPEVIFQEELVFYAVHINADVPEGVYGLYEGNDLRKSTFFDVNQSTGRIRFKGSYNGSVTLFGGFTTAELFLILAESQVRNGNIQDGLATLNHFLVKRYSSGDFEAFKSNDVEESLRFIFLERRKEFVFRGHRWYDLRRLNHEDAFKETLTRNIANSIYTLEPNSSFYILPIIDLEIQTYGLLQNP
ncbi:RagB/SusD family nutrient uptake outer membrane protein [Belliella marina]|uniref:RagB/SusD family nutrient uptake outer membrane protein n=1 Tax=Belliella marina TaxID=1644146 RepID=A0ABW4VQ69_9BACT